MCRSNNLPEIPGSFYLDCVARLSGCPEKVRTDNGTENGVIAVMQCLFRNDPKAHMYGRSTANQRKRDGGRIFDEIDPPGGLISLQI